VGHVAARCGPPPPIRCPRGGQHDGLPAAFGRAGALAFRVFARADYLKVAEFASPTGFKRAMDVGFLIRASAFAPPPLSCTMATILEGRGVRAGTGRRPQAALARAISGIHFVVDVPRVRLIVRPGRWAMALYAGRARLGGYCTWLACQALARALIALSRVDLVSMPSNVLSTKYGAWRLPPKHHADLDVDVTIRGPRFSFEDYDLRWRQDRDHDRVTAFPSCGCCCCSRWRYNARRC